jgi:hypothetical protein
MADINLGQVAGIWVSDTEPIHKNALWLKTIDLLTNEKAGFIWNGIEWINIQGSGFNWTGDFDLPTNYKKNDIVLFESSLYIKRTDIVNNNDNPTQNSDFDIFLPNLSNDLLLLSNFWSLLQSYNVISTKQIYTTKQNITVTGANPVQAINLDNGSLITLNLTGASGTLNLSLTNGKVGASYFIEVLQAATKVDVTLANIGRLDGVTGSTITGVNNQNFIIVAIWNGTGYILNIAPLT